MTTKKKVKKRKQKERSLEPILQRMVDEANSIPLDQTVFIDLAKIANEALSGRRLALPPDSERCIEDQKRSPGKMTIYFTGAPMNQAGFAIIAECRRRFGKRKSGEIFHSFMWRWWAFLDAMKSGILAEFTREAGEILEINTAVFRAAADTPLHGKGKFDQEEFVDRIREIIRNDVDHESE